MKVVHFIPGYKFGGIEKSFENLIKLIDKNFSIELIVENKLFDTESIQKLIDSGINVHIVPRFRIYNINEYTKRIIDILKSIGDIDIVHSYNVTRSYPFFKAAKFLNIKNRIFHARTNQVNGKFFIKLINKYFLGLSIKEATVLIANSKLSGDALFNGKKFTVLNNGINIKEYKFNDRIRTQLRKDLSISNDIVLGHVGRFTYAKNHKFLIKVFSELQIKNKKLLLIGDGPLLKSIKELCNDLGVSDEVIFLGRQNNVYDFYSVFDGFLFPSIYEGFGNVLVEAQASGLKVFASTNVSDSTKIINNFTFLDLDIYKWTKNIEHYYNYSDLKSRKTDSSFYQVLNSGYDVKDNIVAHEMLYKSLVNS